MLDEYPWQVSVQYNRGAGGQYAHYCGGSIISERYILWAAHCAVASKSRDTVSKRRKIINTTTNIFNKESSFDKTHKKRQRVKNIIVF